VERRVIKNTALLSSANVFARIIGFFYFVFLGRVLGVESFGHYNFAIALVYNFYPVADFGVERLILRDLSRDKQKSQEYFQKIIPLRLTFSLVSVIFVTLLGLFLSKSSRDAINILIFAFCLLPWTFNQLVAGIGNAFEKMEIQSLVAICSAGFTAFLGGTAAFLGGDVSLVLIAAVASNLIVSLMMLGYAKKLGLTLKLNIDLEFCRNILRESWVFASLTILAVFYLRSSVVMVNYLKGAYYTGLYSSAFKFIEASILIPQSFALSLFPQTARLLLSDKEKLKGNYLRSLGLIFIFSAFYAGSFYLLAPFLIKVAYGPSYSEAVSVMRILGFAAIFFFLNTLPGNIIQNSPKVKRFIPWLLINFLLSLVLCFFLIPRGGIVGAAWAVFMAELFGIFINNYFVWKILK